VACKTDIVHLFLTFPACHSIQTKKNWIMVIGHGLHNRPKFREIKMAAIIGSLHILNNLPL
jgi:hypothetical protein